MLGTFWEDSGGKWVKVDNTKVVSEALLKMRVYARRTVIVHRDGEH